MPELHLLSVEEVEARVAWPRDQVNPSRGGGAERLPLLQLMMRRSPVMKRRSTTSSTLV